MAYIHICKDVKRTDIFSSIQNYKENWEKKRASEMKEHLRKNTLIPHKLYKHYFDSQHQILIIQAIEVENETVFCFQKIMKHDAGYHFLNQNPRTWQNQNLILDSEKEAIRKMIAKKKQAEDEEGKARDILGELREWIDPVRLDLKSTFYESERWVSHPPPKFRVHWKTFKDILYAIAEDKCEENNSVQLRSISTPSYLASNGNCHVLYTPVWDTNQRVIYFLYAAFCGNAPDNEELQKILKEYPDFPTIDQMVPFARRAYADWILYDEDGDLWRGVEKISIDDEQGDKNKNKPKSVLANLAMSAEEERILKEESQKMPLFINGQAGSGKSTMLFYLFAEFCRLYIQKKRDLAPLFLTYNESLLDIAKEGIHDILNYNSRYDLSGDDKSNLDSKIGPLMWPFQKFVLDKLIPDEYISDFDRRLHLTFTRFYQLYSGRNIPKHETATTCRLPQKNLYSPELVWHVIRTFIKGYSPDGELSPEEYNAISERDKSVSDDVYKGIYESIWKKWYKKLEHRILGEKPRLKRPLWDDQDMIRCALKHSPMFKPESYEGYPVIFCDESQDFTQIELHLLIKLSCFTKKYNLSNASLLPFVFAGDQLQTINPTGFSWQRLRANFLEKLNALGWSKKSLANTELTKNFRSLPSIVKLANLTQFCRYKLLDSDQTKDLKPQDWWQTHEGPAPIKFILGDNISEDELISKVSKTIIIVPAELDDEYQFVDNDELLTKLVKKDKDEKTSKEDKNGKALSENNENEEKSKPRENFENIFTPAGIKGLEFDKVVIYKFGEASDKLLSSLLGKKSDLKKDEPLRAFYFLNKLYVSITRARESLIVVDTQKGDDNLWKYFTEKSSEDIYQYASEDEKNVWPEDKIGYLKMGTPDQIGEIEEKDPLSIAEELRSKGELYRRPDLMERAAEYYRHAHENEKGLECDALANEYNEKWKKAGICWMNLAKLKQDFQNEIERASDCFWRSLAWEQLKALHQEYPGLYPYRLSVAEFMMETSLDSLNEKICSQEQVMKEVSPTDDTWKDVVSKIKIVLKEGLKSKKKGATCRKIRKRKKKTGT